MPDNSEDREGHYDTGYACLLNRFAAVFLVSFGILLFFITPNVNTGDAGELITASYFFGIAHPSGYPLYLLVAKAFTLLPFGSIGFKVALVSAVFSALSLSVLYLLVFKITESDPAAFTASGFLVSSYSYLTQSVIAKFYTLNLFLVLTIFALWFLQLSGKKRGPDSAVRTFQLTCFLFGLIFANHNTGIVMMVPAAFAIWMLRKDLFSDVNRSGVRRLVLMPAALFCLGFAVNAYLFVRGGDLRPFSIFHVRNITEFYLMISRQAYGEIGTLSKAGTLFSNPLSFWYGLKNFVTILAENFGLFSFYLFICGCYYLYRKNIRIFLFVLICFALYGPVFSKIALPGPDVSLMDSYVYAHQYFLPAFAFYALVTGTGLLQNALWLNISSVRYRYRIFTAALVSLFVLLLFFRTSDSNYRTDYVPYQAVVDTYAMMPAGSVFLAFHDNEKYPGRYLKLIGRYREDICHLNGVLLQHDLSGMSDCSKYSYGNINPEIFIREMDKFKSLMAEGNLWAGSPGALSFPIADYSHVLPLSLSYLYLPREWGNDNQAQQGGPVQNLLRKNLPVAESVVRIDVCRDLNAVDLLTNYACDKYTRHMTQLTAYYLSPVKPFIKHDNPAAVDSGGKSRDVGR